MNNRYFLKTEWTGWKEVTKEQWVRAERNAGFINTMGDPNDPGTGGFSGHGILGKILYENANPEVYKYNPDFCKVAWPLKHCYECGNFVDEGTGQVHGRAGAVHSKCLVAY